MPIANGFITIDFLSFKCEAVSAHLLQHCSMLASVSEVSCCNWNTSKGSIEINSLLLLQNREITRSLIYDSAAIDCAFGLLANIVRSK